MIGLSVPEVSIGVVSQAGMIRYLAHNELGDKWFPLSGGYLPVASNPILFGLYGYSIGRATIAGVDSFQLPTYNAGIAPSIFLRPWNSKNSLGRNLNRAVKFIAAGTIKAHNHYGGSSAAGAHGHGGLSARLGPPGAYTGAYGGTNPLNYGIGGSSAGHGAHGHSGSNTTSTQAPAANMSTRVEPKGYSVLACIYKG